MDNGEISFALFVFRTVSECLSMLYERAFGARAIAGLVMSCVRLYLYVCVSVV